MTTVVEEEITVALWKEFSPLGPPHRCCDGAPPQQSLLIGSHFGAVMWINFFDDFCAVEFSVTSGSCEDFVTLLMKAIGWVLTDDADKIAPFMSTFAALGVCFSLNDLLEVGSFTVANKPGRREGICKLIDAALASDRPLVGVCCGYPS
eukprot:6485919-Amphidinium_carterae.1